MVHSGYHLLKHRAIRIVCGWCTVDIILLSIVILGLCLDGAQWRSSSSASSSQHSAWMVHSRYLPLKHRALRIVCGWCTVDIILLSIVILGLCLDGAQWISSSSASSSQDSAWMVHSRYHPLKHRALRIVCGWCTVDIILLSIVILGLCLDGAQWISSSSASSSQDSAWMVHSRYHPLKHRALRIVCGLCTVDIILLSIVILGLCLDGAQWISSSSASSSQDSAWMVHSRYHPLKHRALRIVCGWCTVDIILLSIVILGLCLDGAQWISSSSASSSQDSAWMVHSRYHPLKHRALRIVCGWCTVDIILLSIVILGLCLDGAQWISSSSASSSQDSAWMVHSRYHPLKHRALRIVCGLCTVDIILLSIVILGLCLDGAQWISSSSASSSQDSAWMVHSRYHPLKHRALRIVCGWCTVDIILLSIVILGLCLDGAQWISSSSASSSQDSAWMVHSRYHPLKHRALRIVCGWCTVDIILLSIVILGLCLDGAQWISSSSASSSQDSAWMVHSRYHPLKHSALRIVCGWCTVDIILLSIVILGLCLDGAQWISSSSASSSQDSVWMVHSRYHPLKHRALRIVCGWCTVDIILLSIVILRLCLDGAQWPNKFHKSWICSYDQ